MIIALKYENTSQSRSLAPSTFRHTFGTVVLRILIKLPIAVYRESSRAKWLAVGATIRQEVVQQPYGMGSDEWHIETELRDSIDGEEFTSMIHSPAGSCGE